MSITFGNNNEAHLATYHGAKNSTSARLLDETKSLNVSVLRSWTSDARALLARAKAASDLNVRIL